MSIFNNLIGKRINGLFVARENWTLLVRTTDGKYFRYDTSNDCCNTVWINHLTGISCIGEGNAFDLIRGALVISAEDKEWTDNEVDPDGYEFLQKGFYTITTDRGYIDIEVRNSNNGYYGGTFTEIEDATLEELEDVEQVFEDF